jgi:hypothetical protein
MSPRPASRAGAPSKVASPALRRARRSAFRIWRRLRFEQKVAVAGALLLIVSTLGPFSFVEAAEVLVAIGVLVLLGARADGHDFQLPIRDGTAVLAAGGWAGLLIVVRLFDRPLGQNLLALGCAAILVVAGISERSKEPPPGRRRGPEPDVGDEPTVWLDDETAATATAPTRVRRPPGRAEGESTLEEDTEPLAPPEFEPGGPATSAGRRGPAAEGDPHEEETEDRREELEPGGDEDRLR